jgi:hypothetical protein
VEVSCLVRFGLALAEHRPPCVVPADPPRRPVARLEPGGSDFVGKEPVPELRVIGVRVEDGVGQVGLVEQSVSHRVVAPPLVVLAAEL